MSFGRFGFGRHFEYGIESINISGLAFAAMSYFIAVVADHRGSASGPQFVNADNIGVPKHVADPHIDLVPGGASRRRRKNSARNRSLCSVLVS